MENSMAYSISATDDHCYPGTTVLINKLDIRDQEKLNEAELFIVSVKSLQFEMEPFPEDLDFAYYKRLHQFLFGELYDWAGSVRSVDISKQRTRFCPAAEIPALAEAMFSRIKDPQRFTHVTRDTFVFELADFYSDVNYLHPFREGNGRTQRLFFRQLAERFGYHLDFSAVDSELMMLATIHAASGVLDTLLHVFDQIITKERPEAVKPCSKMDWVEA